MSFVIGVIIGGIIVYFWLQNKMQETQRIEQTLRKQLAQNESDIRNRAAQAEHAEHLEAQAATAESQINSLREQLTAAKSEAAVAHTQPVAHISEALSTPGHPDHPVNGRPAAFFTPVQAEPPVADAPAEILASVQSDDLTKIEGIGPKVSQVLNDNGIVTFAQLASTPASTLREILHTAGPRFKMMEPESWPEQARLAANGAWDDLQKLQDELDGGKYRR